MVANRKSKEPTSMRDNQPPPPAKRIQAREAALKKQVASGRGRGRKAVTDANDENVDLTGLGGSRRSSRLNVTAQGVAGTATETNSNTSAEPLLDKPNAPPVKRNPAGKAPNVNYRGPKSQHLFSSPVGDADGGAATDDEDGEEELAPRSKKSKAPLAGAPSGLEEIQDLKRQLQEERDKNRLLRRTATAQASQTSKAIPKPRGSVGAAGFSLITEILWSADD